jgi:hypothetical protein
LPGWTGRRSAARKRHLRVLRDRLRWRQARKHYRERWRPARTASSRRKRSIWAIPGSWRWLAPVTSGSRCARPRTRGRAAGFGPADPRSQQVPLGRRVLGVAGERRAVMHRHEVVEELHIAGLDLHAKADAWSLRQRVEVHEAGDLVRGEPGHLGEAHGRHCPAGPDGCRGRFPPNSCRAVRAPGPTCGFWWQVQDSNLGRLSSAIFYRPLPVLR